MARKLLVGTRKGVFIARPPRPRLAHRATPSCSATP